MGILDTASEVELIICLALTNPELVGLEDGVLAPITKEAKDAVGTFTNPVDGQEYYYELTPDGLERWVNDALEERYRDTRRSSLPYEVLQALKEQCRTRMQSLIVPDGTPRGLLLSTTRLLETWDDIQHVVVKKHRLSYKVPPRLSVGVWAGATGNGGGTLRVAEPNVTIRIKHPGTEEAAKESAVGRTVIEEVAALVQSTLLQDSVGVRARTLGSDWTFLLAPGDSTGQVEKSVSLFSGTRAAAERIISTINDVLHEGELPKQGFAVEIRPVEQPASEPAHMLMVRHAGTSLSDFMSRLFQKHADNNRSVAPDGVVREFFLPLAHHCRQDWDAHEDLKCGPRKDPPCRRCSVRYRFARQGAPPQTVHDCHCRDHEHPLLGAPDPPAGCTCVEVRMNCCEKVGCARRGSTRFVPVCPDAGNPDTRAWMTKNWDLGWLSKL